MKNKETRIYNGNYEVRLDEDSKETRVSGYAALFDTDSRDCRSGENAPSCRR